MKILEFFGEPLSYGGQEAFIYNMYSNFSCEADYTFLTPFFSNNKELMNMISKRGDKCISCDYEFESLKRKKYIIQAALKYFDNSYDIVHIHSGSIFNLIIAARIAKKSGIRRVIVHSHATGYEDLKHRIIKIVSDYYLEKYADYYLACSKEAGRFKFSDNVIKSNKFRIVNNGIDLEKYKYREEYRVRLRKDLNIGDAYLICNIGRFSAEKNHDFVIDVFFEYMKLNKNSKLLLVGGNGPVKDNVVRKVKELGLMSEVLIMTERNDVNELLSAADVFLFPSLFEGLGISAIEAQTSGLHTICSEYIPEEANVSNTFHRLPLSIGAEEWAQYIAHLSENNRHDGVIEVANGGYNASQCAEELEKIYRECCTK